MTATLAALVALLLCAPCVAAADRQVTTLPGGNIMEAETFPGRPKWQLLPYLWVERSVNVTCPGITDFSVYVAEDPGRLAERVKHRHSAWCGWRAAMSWDSPSCEATISPFKDTAVAVVKPQHHGKSRCSFEEHEQFAAWKIAQALLGSFLFLRAESLVSSMLFRLSTGTGGFVLLSALILAFVIYRSVPNKKSMAATMALFGSSVVSCMRYFVGSWFPSLEQLIYNKWVLLYTGASGLIGLAVTYYYDDPANAKLNTIFTRGLQLAGLGLVATSTTMPEASLALAAILASVKLISRSPVAQYMPRVSTALKGTGEKLQHQLGKSPAVLANGTKAATGAPPTSTERRQARQQQQHRLLHQSQAETDGEAASEDDDVSDVSKEEASAAQRRSSSMLSHPQPADSERTPVAGRRSNGYGHLQGTPETPVSPLIQRGLVYNEATGRTIHIGKSTYNKLVMEGYEIDEARGILTPPPSGSSGQASGRSKLSSPGGRSSANGHVSAGRRSDGGRKKQHLSSAAATALPE